MAGKRAVGHPAPAPTVRGRCSGLAVLPGFLVLTKSESAGCCVLAGHVLILGQGWPRVFMLPEGIVHIFFPHKLIGVSHVTQLP